MTVLTYMQILTLTFYSFNTKLSSLYLTLFIYYIPKPKNTICKLFYTTISILFSSLCYVSII